MANLQEKLAEALKALEKLQKNDRRIFRSAEFSRLHREMLLRHGFLQPVIKGWLMSSSPGAAPGESTPWYASFWEFCALYCEARFQEQWHLSPEQSLLLHAESTTVPVQTLVHSPKGTNNKIVLPFETSVFDLQDKKMPLDDRIVQRDGLRLFAPEEALVRVPETFFTRHPIEAQVVLGGIRDASRILRRLLEGGNSVVAGRLAGALRRIGRVTAADDILAAMKAAGYVVRESDPFDAGQRVGAPPAPVPPIVGRLQAIWGSMREAVIETFPAAPGLPSNKRAYMKVVDGIYRTDAYHSLSIEGYRVTPALIEKVAAGAWDPDNHDADRQSRDTLAARGYWQAFQGVRSVVADILGGGNAGVLAAAAHQEWYRQLFQPCVAAGLIPAHALAGYRDDTVFIHTSRHVPPRKEAVGEAMPALFDLLEREPESSVRAVLGHWLFGYIHPYFDGNGRMARFLMNAMLASGGYPWTIVRVENRSRYLAALESASVDLDIRPFAAFIAECIEDTATQSAWIA